MVVIIRLIRPVIHVKIINLFSDRIAHFVADSIQHYIRLKDMPRNVRHVYWFDKKNLSNLQWAKMVKRNLPVMNYFKYIDFWNKKIPGGKIHVLDSSIWPRDVTGLYEKKKSNFSFLKKEHTNALNWLKSFGWKEKEPFVCLLVRDQGYLQSSAILSLDDMDDTTNKKGWGYHNYRNSDISEYELSIQWLVERGVRVIRMGKNMIKPLSINHELVIDYPFLKETNDLLDVWLFAHCNLCVSTGTGMDYVSDVFRKPILFINFLPLIDFISWSNAMHVPKKLLWADSGKELSLRENINNSWQRAEHYSDHNIKIQDLNKDEILVSIRECWEDLENGLNYTKRDLALQRKYWKILKSEPNFNKQHGWIHPSARAGRNWLRSRQEEFFT